ncbi:TonB-dependent receptor [Simiduia agarivorans]|uniref:TonB-dependent receptor n=1 Tax=Simiduia agarivorans (strain DSM 21679 / JCM 13881 / BCRC 17597 / SA1) TaxID=1117647 RepID=K4KQU1_SIMAS|nr:TonB-dependent receptor [Simiduia agarivorans]AFV00494.1 TonB-dependent receptor [Simiduia agarivorans SA1 = DSM 21679]
MAMKSSFTRNLLAVSIAAGTLSTPAFSQEVAGELEEIVVSGIRMSQATSISNKRNADSVVDSIVAEDIGKLPDVTITDSLQRITGVQIRRSAGEGGALNVRGMPQVLTTLNGEAYMAAGSVTTTQPNFGDIPSSLFAGADVKKSQTAATLSGGITGVVDLKTHKPFNFEEGVTTALTAEYQTGRDTAENDYGLNGLVSINNGDFGAMVAASYSTANLANYYSGMAGGGSDAGWSGFPPENGAPTDNWNFRGEDVNGNGSLDDRYIAYQGHTAYSKFTERERLGLNGAVQWNLGSGFALDADFFYTKMDEWDRRAGIAISDKWQDWAWARPIESTPTGAFAGQEIHTTQVYQADGRRLKSYAENNVIESESTNFNIELSYDNGGSFTGSARALSSSANQLKLNSYADIDMANGSQWGVEFQNYPEGSLATNPGGYADAEIPVVVDYRGDAPVWSGVPQAITGDLDAYALSGLSSEYNYDRKGSMNVFRLDGSYELDGFVKSVDAGVRHSARKAENEGFHLLAPFGNEGCLVRWKSTDVTLNAGGCSFGDGAGTFYTAGRPTPLSDFGANVIQVSDFGSVKGAGSVYTLDPAAMDNVLAFHNSLYPNNVRGVMPGQSYEVDLNETSAYAQVNFSTDSATPVHGNLGLRIVQTDLSVTQSLVGASRPYGAPELDDGDFVTDSSYTDVLPSLNVAWDFAEDWRLRAAAAKTMAPLDLNQWGGGLSPNYALNSSTGIFEIIAASSDGNPELDPWRANNYDVSLEWYHGDSGMVSVGLFRVDVESFVERGSVPMDLPDQDGVIRRTTNVQTNVQGEGGKLQGIEVSARQAFDFLPGIWSNFGVDVNYTYSPSDSGNEDLNGKKLPFIDNSDQLFNFIGWYQGEKLQARIAYNYRSERVVAFNQVWGTEGMTLFQAPTGYIDASVSYDVADDITVYLNGSNLTGEVEDYYIQWENQKAWKNEYEPRYTLGLRAKF